MTNPRYLDRRAAIILAFLLLAFAVVVIAVPAHAQQRQIECPEEVGGVPVAGNPVQELDDEGNWVLHCPYNPDSESASKVRVSVFWTSDDLETETPADCGFEVDDKVEGDKKTVRLISQEKASHSRYVITNVTLDHDEDAANAAAETLLAEGEALAIDCGELPTGSTTTTAPAETTTTEGSGETTTTAAGTTTTSGTDTTVTTLVAAGEEGDSGGSSSSAQIFVIGLVVLVLAGLGGYVWYQRSNKGSAGGGPDQPPPATSA